MQELKNILAVAATCGAQQAEVQIDDTIRHELAFSTRKITMLRSTNDRAVSISILDAEGRRATANLNETSDAAVGAACERLMGTLCDLLPDNGNVLNENMEEKRYSYGTECCDFNLLHNRVSVFLENMRKKYPRIRFEASSLSYIEESSRRLNSYGNHSTVRNANYHFLLYYLAQDTNGISSFNYCWFADSKLDMPLAEYCDCDERLSNAEREIVTTPLSGKYEGTLLLHPDMVSQFLEVFCGHLQGAGMINGTSLLKGKLDQQVASKMLNFSCMPQCGDFSCYAPIGDDGYENKNTTVVENGVLQTYLLNNYWARKAEMPRSAASCTGYFAMQPGKCSRDELIKGTKRGIVLNRFSCGQPDSNGNFSGIAKNSYYIENGEIKYPVSEVMLNGNVFEMFRSISGISRERINNGNSVLPWMKVEGVTISGAE